MSSPSKPTSSIGTQITYDPALLKAASDTFRTRSWKPRPRLATDLTNAVNMNGIRYAASTVVANGKTYSLPEIAAVGFSQAGAAMPPDHVCRRHLATDDPPDHRLTLGSRR